MDDFFEHFTKQVIVISIIITVGIIFGAGYFSGQSGQWWWGLVILGFYPVLLALMKH